MGRFVFIKGMKSEKMARKTTSSACGETWNPFPEPALAIAPYTM